MPENKIFQNNEYSIVCSTSDIIDENCCGAIEEYYLCAQTQLMIESLHYNSCLNRKISIDTRGNIKNCPSMNCSYGNILNGDRMIDAAQMSEFQKMWKITKNDIEVCKDCEFRYVCQDCRAYITDCNNIYSKPKKCNYNPYEE